MLLFVPLTASDFIVRTYFWKTAKNCYQLSFSFIHLYKSIVIKLFAINAADYTENALLSFAYDLVLLVYNTISIILVY